MADLITPEMPVSPLEDLFNAIAAKVEGETSASVDSESARLARFPNPVQGNRVYRSDLGYEEAYFGLYNVTSNPGGTPVVGWHPTAGKLPMCARTIGSAQTMANAQMVKLVNFGAARPGAPDSGITLATGTFTVARGGLYQCLANVTAAAAGNYEVNVNGFINGTRQTDFTDTDVGTDGHYPHGRAAWTFPLVAGDTFDLRVQHQYAGSIGVQVLHASLRYVGPA